MAGKNLTAEECARVLNTLDLDSSDHEALQEMVELFFVTPTLPSAIHGLGNRDFDQADSGAVYLKQQ